jgi:hypothetical protein
MPHCAGPDVAIMPRTTQAERRFLPLARRRASTRTPPTVDMRFLKPWRRLRTSRLGW